MHARPRAIFPSARPNNLGKKYWQSSCSSPETNRHTALDKKIETDKAGFSIDTFTESCVRTNTTDKTLGTTPTLTVVTERPDYIATPDSYLAFKTQGQGWRKSCREGGRVLLGNAAQPRAHPHELQQAVHPVGYSHVGKPDLRGSRKKRKKRRRK